MTEISLLHRGIIGPDDPLPATREGERLLTEEEWVARQRHLHGPQTQTSGQGSRGGRRLATGQEGGDGSDREPPRDRPTDEGEFQGDRDAKRFAYIWAFDERLGRASGYGSVITAMRSEFQDLDRPAKRRLALSFLLDRIMWTESARRFTERAYDAAERVRISASQLVPSEAFYLDPYKDQYGPFARDPKLEEIERRLLAKYMELIEFPEVSNYWQFLHQDLERDRMVQWMHQINERYNPSIRFFGR